MRVLVKAVAPAFVRNYFRSIQDRLSVLETQLERIDDLQTTIVVLQETIDEVVRNPRFERGPDVGFNGQLLRKGIFADLLSAFPFDTIIETGTWFGNTTGYMAETSRLPVFSGELNYRFHALAAQRLVDFPSITLRQADSRRFLSDLAAEPGLKSRFPFFYLDAHWHDDLPLASEIEIVAGAWNEFVIMIDDFEVPGDAGYGYDDYGPGKSLTFDYIAPVMRQHDIAAYVPSASSESETGHKRGCVVLARRGKSSATLDELQSLRAV